MKTGYKLLKHTEELKDLKNDIKAVESIVESWGPLTVQLISLGKEYVANPDQRDEIGPKVYAALKALGEAVLLLADVKLIQTLGLAAGIIDTYNALQDVSNKWVPRVAELEDEITQRKLDIVDSELQIAIYEQEIAELESCLAGEHDGEAISSADSQATILAEPGTLSVQDLELPKQLAVFDRHVSEPGGRLASELDDLMNWAVSANQDISRLDIAILNDAGYGAKLGHGGKRSSWLPGNAKETDFITSEFAGADGQAAPGIVLDTFEQLQSRAEWTLW